MREREGEIALTSYLSTCSSSSSRKRSRSSSIHRLTGKAKAVFTSKVTKSVILLYIHHHHICEHRRTNEALQEEEKREKKSFLPVTENEKTDSSVFKLE